MPIDKILGVVAPHSCKGCGVSGSGLCTDCFANLVDTGYGRCIYCGSLTSKDNLCSTCRSTSPFKRAYVVGERDGALKRLVGDYKYNSERGNTRILADLVDATVPIPPDGTVVVPIPTISAHIRQRGFGHSELIARRFARGRHLKYDGRLLLRNTNSVQHGLSLQQRRQQAAQAFRVSKRRTMPDEILLIDDIYTTGATIAAASKLLLAAGVKTINVAVVARQVKK